MHHATNHLYEDLSHHPLALSYLTILRDKTTPAPIFAATASRLSLLIASYVTNHASYECNKIDTPLQDNVHGFVAHTPVLVPILRAGMSLLPAFQQLFPEAPIGFAGVGRNKATHIAEFYSWVMPNVKGKTVYLLDPMLATGSSAILVIDRLLEAGAKHIHLATVIASRQGVNTINSKYPTDVTVHTATIDNVLNENNYIVPGLGDFGDRLYGTF